MNQRAEGVRWAFNFANWRPTREQWIKAVRCIQQEEKQRIGKFVYDKDAKASMVGRLLMRKFMVEQLHISNLLLKLGRTDHEKPYLINEVSPEVAPALSFNVSHHGSFCVLAAEPDRPIGVDVMTIQQEGNKNRERFFDLMKRQFTSAEWKTINSGNTEADQFYLFHRHWCLKESYVKALGVGIGFNLQRVSFSLKTQQLTEDSVTQDTCLYVDGSLASNWRFEESMVDDLHCVAVAVGSSAVIQDQPKKNLFTALTFDELVGNLEPVHPPDEDYWNAFCRKLPTFQRDLDANR